MRYFGLLVAFVFCSLGQQGEVRAQEAAPRSPYEAFAAAIEQVKQGSPREGARQLARLRQQHPGFRSLGSASLSYWLARAHEEAGQERRAQAVRAGAVRRFIEQPSELEVPLAFDFIEGAFARSDHKHRSLAGRAYLLLLRALDTGILDEQRTSILDTHVVPLSFILSDGFAKQIGLEVVQERERRFVKRLPLGSGERLAAWWRQEDPLPATLENERLHEHLARVRRARHEYSDAGTMDDRAKIYIRLGEPTKTNKIPSRARALRNHPEIYKDNEFWVYPHVDNWAHYFFIDKENRTGYYELSQPTEFLPPRLRVGTANSAEQFVRAMEVVYRRLSLLHPHYAGPYTKITHYRTLLDTREIAGRQMSVSNMRPAEFARSYLNRADSEEALTFYNRKKFVEPSYSNLLENVEPLPVSVRYARFLEENGSTRTEMYWSLAREAIIESSQKDAPDSQGYMLVSSAVRQPVGALEARTIKREHHTFSGQGRAGSIIAPQTATLSGKKGRRFHLSAQWELYRAKNDRDGAPTLSGRLLRQNVYRADSLSPLRSDRLEMSDLKPLLAPARASKTSEAGWMQGASPYPFAFLSSEAPLPLYFEVYNLSFSKEGRARYQLEYEVYRRSQEGGLRSLFQDRREKRTSTQLTQESSTRRTQEYILLDVSDWQEKSDLVVKVHVTDLRNDAQVERTIEFSYVPDASLASR